MKRRRGIATLSINFYRSSAPACFLFQRFQHITFRSSSLKQNSGCEGLIDANLGGGVYKKRIAAGGRGKSGGARAIVAFKAKNHIFFLFGFLKNEQENIDTKELKALKQFASALFELQDQQLVRLLNNGNLYEVN